MSPRADRSLLLDEASEDEVDKVDDAEEEEEEEEVFHTPIFSKSSDIDSPPVIDEVNDKKKKKERNPRPGESTVDFLLRKDKTGKKLRLHVQFLESRLADRELNAKLTDIESLIQTLQWYAGRTYYKGEQPEVLEDEGRRARIVLEAVKEAKI